MPNPKVGTVTFDLKTAVREAKAGKVEYRVDKAGIVHCRVGRKSFDSSKLSENATALLRELMAKKPSTAKGTYLRSITLTSTMGPGIRIDTSTVAGEGEEER
jgi:large subunit ribosomal protein L1